MYSILKVEGEFKVNTDLCLQLPTYNNFAVYVKGCQYDQMLYLFCKTGLYFHLNTVMYMYYYITSGNFYRESTFTAQKGERNCKSIGFYMFYRSIIKLTKILVSYLLTHMYYRYKCMMHIHVHVHHACYI